MRKTSFLAVCSALSVVTYPGVGSARDYGTVPTIVDFENPQYDALHRDMAERLDGSLVDGALVVEADRQPGNCLTFRVSLTDDGTRGTFVDVEADVPADDAGDGLLRGAGLIIRHGAEGSRFLAVLVTRGGHQVIAFVDGAVPQRIGGSTGEVPDWPVTLAARESSGGADFYLNGERIAGLSDSRVTGRAVGLIHCGPGRFVFDDWGLNSTGTIDAVREAAVTDPDPVDTEADPGDTEVVENGSDTPAHAARTAGTPPPPPRAEWWVEDNGTPVGPITLPELRARLRDGRSDATSLVWREGMAEWTPAQEALD